MVRKLQISCWFLAGFTSLTARADDFNFEVGVAYDRTDFDGSQTIFAPGGTLIDTRDSETDDLTLFGSWYFSGLSDANGPRARAAFVDRASVLSFNYVRTEASYLLGRDSELPSIPSLGLEFDGSGDSFAVNGRLVSRDSGWFGNASLASTDVGLATTFVDGSVDATVWSLGFGKYLWDNTAISLDVGQFEEGAFDATTAALSFSHLATLGADWQFAVDLSYGRTDGDSDYDINSWLVGLSFYPTRDFEFGLRYRVDDFSRDLLDQSGVEGFASWFVTPKLELAARYGVDDVDHFPSVFIGGASTSGDADQSSFGLSINYRF